ncbi:MAG: hypothetical protein ACK5WZ_10370 [Pseudobdellovibrionaceae bacterium]
MSTYLARMLIFGTLTVLAGMNTGCSSDPDLDEVSGRVKVRMPWMLSDLSLNASDPKLDSAVHAKQNPISLQFIEISEIKNLKRVQGSFAEFLLYPQLSGSDLSGVFPEAQFIKYKNDRYVAVNALSIQMAALYAHAERLRAFDTLLGVKVNTGPRTIALFDVEDRGETNNAFYHGESDAMFFLPFTGSNVSTTFNSGIFAHEHFHSIFYKIVHRPLIASQVLPQNMNPSLHGNAIREKLESSNSNVLVKAVPGTMATNQKDVSVLSTLSVNDQNYARILIQGLNEGVADIWGWAYTGNPDFIAISLSSEKDARTLVSVAKTEDQFFRFPPKCVVQRFVEDVQASDVENKPNFYRAKSYEFGTAFARIMKLYAENIQVAEGITNAEARVKVAKQIVEFLPRVKDYYATQLSQMVPIDLFKKFAQTQTLTQNQCQFFLRILNSPFNDGGFKSVCEVSTNDHYVIQQTTETKEEFCR